MSIWKNLLISLDSLRVNKLRSLLTMIGIIVGVASVVLVVSIGQIGKGSVVSELAKYSPGVFFVTPSTTATKADKIQITMTDLKQVSRLEGVQAASGSLAMTMASKSGDSTINFNVTGTFADIVKFMNLKTESGRFFTVSEQKSRQKVIVVESDYAISQFGSAEQAVNRKITLDGNKYEIVGVYKSDKSILSGLDGKNYSAYMPYDSLPLLKEGTNNELDSLMVIANTTNSMEKDKSGKAITSHLAKAHNTESSDYEVQKVEDFQRNLDVVFNVMQILIGSIAGISLLVGGVGVMNIMLVSVTERTREIGTRKAIGATPGLILQQFMMEAIILCFLGGVVGISIGVLGSFAFSLITKWQFILSGWTIVIAFGFSTAVGLFFGWYPAKKAANMQPIESLRYE
ncbi:FtsX-like permease family protein [Paenibacillus sp. LMG 31458]|uniref:FtsX-like permease family protein n=1 Tax=Paenibacillus phytorum TaxID=2654977 RepID=A0ABX1XRD9_9BACL|nr:ABC transporter permease [Paenibacillus phytorum]NOU71098.1 FtsX-like permease family protein [Paenibacillus phytorum]